VPLCGRPQIILNRKRLREGQRGRAVAVIAGKPCAFAIAVAASGASTSPTKPRAFPGGG